MKTNHITKISSIKSKQQENKLHERWHVLNILSFYIKKMIIYQNTSLYTTLYHPRVQISKHPQFPQIKINSVNIFLKTISKIFFPSIFSIVYLQILTRLCNTYLFFKKPQQNSVNEAPYITRRSKYYIFISLII